MKTPTLHVLVSLFNNLLSVAPETRWVTSNTATTKAHRGTLFGSCSLAPADQDVEYDGLGNITRKADVGNYSYLGAGPHAVTQAGGVTYTYDANGNQTGGDGRSLEYNSFDKPTQITKGDHTTTFKYGPSRSRYLRTDQVNNPDTGLAPKKTTRYIGNVERIQTEGQNEITWRRHLGGAVYTIKTDANFQPLSGSDANTRHYVYQDHLGSTDVITDQEGFVIQSMSFDAWGQRRNEQDWDAIISGDQLRAFDTDITNKGYTGHEQLDEVGLIHMNGRVYDPKLARFLQADPFIQAADNTRSYNRYAYVINNPLNATDPSGFIFGKLFKGLNKLLGDFAPFVSIGLLAIPGVGAWAAASWQNAFAFGFVTGGISTGSVRGAVVGGLSAVAFHGIGNKFVGGKGSGFLEKGGLGHIGAHGAVGGLSSVLQGGKFGHGFASAGITKASGVNDILGDDTTLSADTVRVAAAALVGGTVSEITGGKFANGATTAALAQALNDNASKQREEAKRIDAQERRNMIGALKNEQEWLNSLSPGEKEVLFKLGGLKGNADLELLKLQLQIQNEILALTIDGTAQSLSGTPGDTATGLFGDMASEVSDTIGKAGRATGFLSNVRSIKTISDLSRLSGNRNVNYSATYDCDHSCELIINIKE